ncbi:hypothetical protein [Cyanobium gracile]|uniref:Uncharacterized protein n=1 Tax=Cyanobium gracile (strain ATCC 27147 / PCC 6307) TaxID=292564 RepID=K9PBH1_CYAGP|nr:hypothetical protein [Cyanobium gracile]AFY30298.1 hypothetical protein Cyagr_3219 [Cyanobium gracile PCC 6307]
MSLPSPRPELSHLLLDAIRRRDAATVARLTGQWAHRHGVTSLESFRTGSVVAEAGWEAGDWLLQHMDAAMAPASVTMAEAFAALEDSFAGPPPPTPISAVPGPVTPITVVPEATDAVTDAIEARVPAPSAEAEGAAGLSDVIALHPLTPSASPAPAPPTLADLRSWLSAAPQHRRAS